MSDWIIPCVVTVSTTVALRVAFVFTKRGVAKRERSLRQFVAGSQVLFVMLAILVSTLILRLLEYDVMLWALGFWGMLSWLAATLMLPGPDVGE